MEWWQSGLPVLVLASSLVTGLVIFPLREDQVRLRSVLNMTGASVKVVLVVLMVWGVSQGVQFETRFAFMLGFDFVLRVDPISLIFAALSAGLWWLTTVYAIGYLERAPHRSRFFGFFSLCVTATMGVALAGNLLTFFIFYELLTVATYPLVVHRGTPRALAAGRTYLLYTLAGGMLLLAGVIGLHLVAGPVEFRTGGALDGMVDGRAGELRIVFGLLIAGLGVKAALVPLHSWLPEAMVAPGAGVGAPPRGRRGQGRRVRHHQGHPRPLRRGRRRRARCPAAARDRGQHHDRVRLASRPARARAEAPAGLLDGEPGVVHRARGGAAGTGRDHRCARPPHPPGADEDHPVLLRRQPVGGARRAAGRPARRDGPPHARDDDGIHAHGLRHDRRAADGRLHQQVAPRAGRDRCGPTMGPGVLAASSILNAAYFLPLIYTAWFTEPMAGNLGLILAADMITFYVFFAVMSFASYGLIVHSGNREALQAGRVYIVLVIVGELLLFTGIMATAAISGRVDVSGAPGVVAELPWGSVVAALLLAGFGVKVGALPLHVWLPLAHPAAPTPASAILSGAMIKAGLLGWIRFLPLGETALPDWGVLCVVVGLTGAFTGVFVGLTQMNPKTALAYSSISQMGVLTVAVGAGLVAPEAWPVLLPAVLLYATHHGLAKGALFLGVGVAAAWTAERRWWRAVMMAGLVLPALALSGLPLTSGSASKVALKNALADVPLSLDAIDLALSWAAVGTTLLMARFLWLVTRPDASGPLHASKPGARVSPGIWLPWMVLIAIGTLFVWVLPFAGFRAAAAAALTPAYVWSTLWPPVVGGVLAWLAWSRPDRLARPRVRLHVPAGDLLWPLLHVSRRVSTALRWDVRDLVLVRASPLLSVRLAEGAAFAPVVDMERHLTSWLMVGVALLAIGLGLSVLLAW
jgi:formate hydrogenlyase subunit 3/multisubunit Na+/H+ antiporter MnhD subunit